MTSFDILNNPLVLVLVGIIISAFIARSVIKGRKGKVGPATIEEIAQLKLNLERAQLQDKIARVNQDKPQSGASKFLSSFLKGSEAGRKARKEFRL